MKKQLLLSFLIFVASLKLQSQIAGSFTVPGSFPTIAAAINTLNLTGVAGAVTINVTAGYTEIVPVGGFKLKNPPGSSTTTILFKKQGIGSNPLISAYTGGTATANSNLRDGIWMFVDCQNVTVDGIDLVDPNTSAPAGMEFGYGFYKATGIGANKNNTIRNCVITLGGAASSNSKGIELCINNYTSNTNFVAPSSTLNTNSYNSFYNNLIQKSDFGFYFYQNTNSPDIGNNIGGLSAVTGNTVINFGGYGAFANGIYTDAQSQINISYNLINNNNGAGSISGNGIKGIYVTGSNASINNNTISLQCTGVSAPLVGISQSAGAGSNFGTSNINNNVFPLLSTSVSLVSSNTVIAAIGNDKVFINNNYIAGFNASTGTVSIISATDGWNASINNNTIAGTTVTSQGQVNGIYSTCNQDQLITNNFISNVFAPSTNSNAFNRICGINSTGVWSLTATSNTISNLFGSEIYGVYLTSYYSGPTYMIASNQLTNFSVAPTSSVGAAPTGILAVVNSTANGNITIRGNLMYDLKGSASGGGTTRGIVCGGGGTSRIFRNKIYNLSSSGSYGVYGIGASSTQNYIYNNLIGGLDISSGGNISALNLGGVGKVYFNSFYMNTSTATSTVGTNLIENVNSFAVDLRNNILVNTSSGPGVPAIIITNNIASTSNNNAFYVGAGGLISRTVPSSTVLSGYQSAYNSDSQSFIENPPFVSTTGSNPNFLNINASIPTQIESGAVAISTITTDFANAVRSATPDVGAWEGSYIAADATAPVVVNSGFTGPPCNGTNRTFTATLTDASAVATGSVAPRLYCRVNFGLYTSTQGTLTSGSTTNGTWSFALNYTANLNDVIWYFLAVQDTSYLNNLRIIPNTGASATNVNNVNVPPNPAYNYTVQTFPTISLAVTSATNCSGQPFVIQASGASSYSYTPGNSATVSPVVNTTYTVTGASSLGCPSTNTLTLSLTTTPVPTITVNSGSVCSGGSFVIQPSGALSYTYSGGSATVSPLSTTPFTVSGTGASGCVGQAVSNVTVQALPVINVSSSNPTICVGLSATLTANGATSYTWSTGTVNMTEVVSPTATSVYSVNGMSNGCSGNATLTQYVDQCAGFNTYSIAGNSFKIVPNPATGIFKIEAGEPVKIEIYNSLGQKLFESYSGNCTEVSLEDHAKGIYLVHVTNAKQRVFIAKLVLTN